MPDLDTIGQIAFAIGVIAIIATLIRSEISHNGKITF